MLFLYELDFFAILLLPLTGQATHMFSRRTGSTWIAILMVANLLGQIHQQFIDTVREGRGDRLSGDQDIFSGLMWTGEKSVELGLVDELGSSSYVAREVIGAENIVDFTPGRSYLERLAKRFGSAAADSVVTALGLSGSRLH